MLLSAMCSPPTQHSPYMCRHTHDADPESNLVFSLNIQTQPKINSLLRTLGGGHRVLL